MPQNETSGLSEEESCKLTEMLGTIQHAKTTQIT